MPHSAQVQVLWTTHANSTTIDIRLPASVRICNTQLPLTCVRSALKWQSVPWWVQLCISLCISIIPQF